MRIIREFPSRRGTGRGHSVREGDNGDLFCTCEAAEYDKECWALKIIQGERMHDQLMKKIRLRMGIKLPDQEAKRKEAINGVHEFMKAQAFWWRVWLEYSSNFPQPEEPRLRNDCVWESES